MTGPEQSASPLGGHQGRSARPLVSVIVPNYNHAAFLDERLASIRGQSMQDLELILLDDASTDDSVALLQRMADSYPRTTHLVVNERNSGSPFKQWQKGIALAKGTWIWIAESDDRCQPDILDRLLQHNAVHGDQLGLVYCQSRVIDAQGRPLGTMAAYTSVFDPDPFRTDLALSGRQFLQDYLKVKNVIPNASAVIFKKELVDDPAIWHGLDDLRMLGDWVLWTRLALRTDIGFIHAELNDFREHADVSRIHSSFEKKKRRVLEEVLLRKELARTGLVQQSNEELSLYWRWASMVRLFHLFNSETDRGRLPPRSRSSFLRTLLRLKFSQCMEKNKA